MIKKLYFPINYTDPMNGVFRFLHKENQINYVIGSERDKKDRSPHAIDLTKNEKDTWYSSKGQLNEYFEFAILHYDFYIIGYALMAYHDDDNIPRNWNIVCKEGEAEKIISKEENNNQLCPGKKGLEKCGESDKKAFIAQTPMKCNRIRYQITGPDSNNEYIIILSGFELFGYLSYRYLSINCRQCFPFRIYNLFIILIP